MTENAGEISRGNFLKTLAVSAGGALLSRFSQPGTASAESAPVVPNAPEEVGSLESPLSEDQVISYTKEISEYGKPVEDTTYQTTYYVYPDPYKKLPESFGYSSFAAFISNHAALMTRAMRQTGHVHPFTGKEMSFGIRRIMLLAEGGGMFPTKDSYYGGNPSIDPKFVSKEQTAYARRDAEGKLVDCGTGHELFHHFSWISDMYRLDMDADQDPALAGVPIEWQKFRSNNQFARYGGGIMSGVSSSEEMLPILEPYASWLLMSRTAEGRDGTEDYSRYAEVSNYRTRVASGDSIKMTIRNDNLPAGITSVDIYRSEGVGEQAESSASLSVDELMEMHSRKHDEARAAEAQTSKRFVHMEQVAFNPGQSRELRIRNPFSTCEGVTETASDILVRPFDGLSVAVYRDKAGKPLAIRYLPVTDITAGQPLDASLHKSEMSIGLNIAVLGQDENPETFDSNIDYRDGTHTHLPDQTDVKMFELLAPPEPNPTPKPTPPVVSRRELLLPWTRK